MILTAPSLADEADPPEPPPVGGGGTYAYSLDRETFRGRYPDRASAVAAAKEALSRWPAAAEAIWVGRHARPAVPSGGWARR